MINPAPTTKIDPKLARGTFVEMVPETATRPGYAVLTFPNTSYRVHLIPERPITTEPGKRILGTIHAKARRIDKVETGGRYLEPVYGRPRRVQGRVVAIAGNEVVVSAGAPVHCEPTDKRQKVTDFAEGDFVSFDVLDGATFRPAP